MSFIAELKRRNVFKVMVAYLVVAWLALQIVDTLADPLHLPDWVSSVVFVFLLIGFPVAMILAWAYELTPEGVKKAEEVDKDASITHVTGRKINTVIMVLLVTAAGYFFWESRLAGPPAAETTQNQASPGATGNSEQNLSIAVLPFVNMSSDAEQEYFSDGLSEELLNVLAHVPQLKVAARTSSFYFKGKNLPISEVAAKLNVAHVLEGSVRKAGEKIRITAQLIRAADGFHLWSGTYDRKLDDVFVIQDEISRAIVGALQIKMGLGEDKSNPISKAIQSTSPEAHKAYLLGKEALRKRTNASIKEAVEYFQRALEIDPEYAPAMARLAESWMLLRSSRATYGDLSHEEVVSKARPLLDKALSLQPELAEAHAALGLLYYGEDKYELALQSLDKAIKINPNLTVAHAWRNNLTGRMGRYRETLQASKENYQRDPLSVLVMSNLLGRMHDLGETEGFDEILQSLHQLGPRHALDIEGSLVAEKYQYGLAAKLELEEFMASDRVRLPAVIFDLGLLGLQQTLEPLVQQSGRWVDRVILHMANDDVASARKILEKRMLEKKGDDHRQWIANLQYFERNWQEANDLFELLWDERKDYLMENRDFGTNDLTRFALTRKQTGKKAEMKPLLDLVEAEIKRQKDQGMVFNNYRYPQMALHFARNEQQEGLAMLEQWVEEGLVNDNVIGDPVFDVVRQNPRYMAAVEKMEANRLKQRHLFLKDICTNNPFADFWQPGEENCKEVQP